MQYANSSNNIFTLNYTGVVNYYYYDDNNEKQDLSFQCKNACFRIDSIGKIYWKSGQFVNGQWYDGQWENQSTTDNGQTWQSSQQVVSFWKSGIWRNGKFYKGQWQNGFFNAGHFYFGYWLNGVFGYDSLIKDNAIAQWHDGYFYGGIFAGTQWYNGVYCTTSDIQSYWLVKDKDNYLLWQGGYINEQYSNVAPRQTVYNNGSYINTSGRITYLIINDNSYIENQFVCANSVFQIDTIGNLIIHSGNYYNGQFNNVNISNSMLNGFELEQCVINKCNISNSTLLNCTVNNEQNNITNCQWYNGELNGGQFLNSIWYDGIFNYGLFSNSIWYDGQWNKQADYNAYWETNSQWYGGQWYGGYVDWQWSNTSPYIIGNNKTYDMFTGQLLYKYQNKDYVIKVANAGISIDTNGIIIFISGVWKSGEFNDGYFINSQFEDGVFHNGSFENSIWYKGTFNNGTFYSSVWYNGTFNGGVFDRSDWHDGYFTDGEFKSGHWYGGYFSGGDWKTLNSFWHNGVWVGGTQNGNLPDNYHDQTYVAYLTQSELQNNIYTIELLDYDFKIQLYDNDNNKIQVQVINSYYECQNIGYYVKKQSYDNGLEKRFLYLCFKNEIQNYYKLTYTYVLQDSSPKIVLISDYQQYLQKDRANLITGQFTYIVENQNNQQQYYTIQVQDANFSIDNGFIYWNNGVFKDGIWYNGEWNTNDTQFLNLLQPIHEQLMIKLQRCVWQNGIWMNGNWNHNQSVWKNGQWLKGTINNIQSDIAPNFEIGNGKNYTNYHGLIKYIYQDEKQVKHFGYLQFADADFEISSDGYITVNKGNLTDCYWYNGQWYGDNWYNGQWKNGTWNCGVWHNGTWHNGTWRISITDSDNIEKTKYKPGCYRNVGVRYVDTEYQIPNRGFFIDQQQQYDSDYFSSYSSNSDSSYVSETIYDQWTDQEYQGFYGNILNDLMQNYSSSSSGSSSSFEYQYGVENKIAVLVKKWVDSKWEQGFIKDIKSFHPPMYGIANGNEYRDFTQDLLYYYPIYNEDGTFKYNQYFFLSCNNASFKVDDNGNIFWQGGNLLNSQWKNGQWRGGIFINSIWHNGSWYNGQFSSGTWYDGIWHNGYIISRNLIWHKGQWKVGYIDQMKSYCSPAIYTANNHLFVNYTGVMKYYNVVKLQYYKIDVTNACFFVSQNGQIVFYNGVWNNGTFIGYYKTANLDESKYNYLLQQVIIKMGQVYQYRSGSKTITYILNMNSNIFDSEKTLNSFYIDSSGTYKLQEVFNDTNSYVSTWSNGTFSNGTWYNGEWIDGEWLTNDNNQPIGEWITGLINGIVEKQPPAYTVVSDENDFYHFANFTGRIKYKVNFFNDQTLKINQYLTTFSCKNAYFDIQYSNATKNKQTYRQVIIKWYDGQWNNGTWHFGIWKKGQWKNGTWQTGYWLDGTWENGTWISGTWYNGVWKKGQKKMMSVLNMISY